MKRNQTLRLILSILEEYIIQVHNLVTWFGVISPVSYFCAKNTTLINHKIEELISRIVNNFQRSLEG